MESCPEQNWFICLVLRLPIAGSTYQIRFYVPSSETKLHHFGPFGVLQFLEIDLLSFPGTEAGEGAATRQQGAQQKLGHSINQDEG